MQFIEFLEALTRASDKLSMADYYSVIFFNLAKWTYNGLKNSLTFMYQTFSPYYVFI